jgi:uncharacterized membrane protein
MSNQFISPNWHVLLIHYPLAFLSCGILIEIFSFLWPRGFFRAAGRWMILLGALLSLPAMAAGIYAFRATVVTVSADPRMMPWHQVVHESPWTADQWRFMKYHLILNCIGVGLVVLGVAAWVAASDRWRRRLYVPVLVALVCGMGSFAVGSWFGGESVYRLGTANETASKEEPEATPHRIELSDDIKWYIPPIELHIVMAGLVVAVCVASLALTIRRLDRPAPKPEPAELIGPKDTAMTPPEPGTHEPLELVTPEEAAIISAPVPIATPPTEAAVIIHAGRFWLLTFLVALVTAFAGVWSVVNTFNRQNLQRNWEYLMHPAGKYRLLLHSIFGASILLLPLILALLARYGRRRRGATTAFLILIVLAIGIQFFLGIAIYYDGPKGFFYRFNP